MAKKSPQTKLYRIMGRLMKKFTPDDILHEMSVIAEQNSIGSSTEAEVEFWLKTSRACANLSSGTEKWLQEAADELEEEE